MNDKRLLFLAYHFPPQRTVASVRTGNIAKYLSRAGWKVTVVTPDPVLWTKKDENDPFLQPSSTSLSRIATGHRYRFLISSSVRFRSFCPPLFAARMGLRLARALRIEPQLGWWPAVTSEVWLTAQHRTMLDQALAVFDIQPDLDLNLMAANRTLSGFTARAIDALGGIILAAGTETALSYYFFKLTDPVEQRRTVTSTGVYLFAINTLVVAAAWLAAAPLTRLAFGFETSPVYFRIAILSVPFASFVTLNLNLLRLNRRPELYILVTISQLLLTTLLSIYLVLFQRIGILGVFWASLGGSALSAMFAGIMNLRYFALSAFGWLRLRQVVGYGMPLIIGGLSMWAINCLDRYFLLRYTTVEQVGLYSVGLRLASVTGFFTWAFRLANAPVQFEVSSDPEAQRVYSRTFSYFVMFASMICVMVALFARPALRVLVPEQYLDASKIVGLAAASAAAYGLYQVVGVGLLITERTRFTGVALAIGALLNLGYLFLLVPWLGMVGAAVAVLMTHLSVVTILFLGAQRSYPVPYDLGLVTRVGIAASIVVLVRTLITPSGFWVDTAVGTVFLSGYVVILAALHRSAEPEVSYKIFAIVERAAHAAIKRSSFRM